MFPAACWPSAVGSRPGETRTKLQSSRSRSSSQKIATRRLHTSAQVTRKSTNASAVRLDVHLLPAHSAQCKREREREREREKRERELEREKEREKEREREREGVWYQGVHLKIS